MSRFPVALRWALAGLIAVVALAVALWPRERDADTAADDGQRARPSAQVSERQRLDADLAACPRPAPGATGSGPLAGISVDCLADGGNVDLAAALAGKPALLNLWAYWCGPCAQELPYLQQFAQRAGNAITVLTVHSDPDEAKAISRLTGLNVKLPGVLDADARVRTAVGAPAVLPISVLLRADGSVARVEVRAFTGVDDIAGTVGRELGVAA
ncbi:thiol-disulfide isomerase/thioredoxin [Nocardia tenerifensis]|uniref:Thiol-disulfide isomerase/thioredoxin n=1 Tax=Nocardia tenerifensis TaxID=228006 RepID=A0A318KCQ4_9NOCA|nr:TlpA disulfide reductase family protein [Nocardia tenerifensis]PXX63291.1 thiol-disulfide isomerase/thioredoxin [Nocardia tenerifensis]